LEASILLKKLFDIMEQAPPPPKQRSPAIYMTPQLEKRRDGLCPSLLIVKDGEVKSPKAPPGGAGKTYRTNSMLLLQVEDKSGVSREVAELQTLIDSISSALKSLVNPDDGELVALSFKPEGCMWKMEFDPSMKDVERNFRMEVVLYANTVTGLTNYELDTVLVPKVVVDPNPLAPALKGFKDAKATFDVVSLAVRKAIVRLEFPEFPEGCKGRAFREIYQLNARVRIFLLCVDFTLYTKMILQVESYSAFYSKLEPHSLILSKLYSSA
jgi:hypothetical protein